MKIMKNVLACLLAAALLGMCIVCTAAETEVTTVSLDSVYTVKSNAKALAEVKIGTAVAIKSNTRAYFVYRLSDAQLKKLSEATSVSLDIAFKTANEAEYTATLIAQKSESGIFTAADAWGTSGTAVTATMDENKVASFDVKSAMQDESQTDSLFMFKVVGTNTITTSDANPVLKITTAVKNAAMLDAEEIKVPSDVNADFVLPSAGARGSAITWESDNAAIAINGANAAVTRPAYGDGNTAVKLKATVVNGNDTATADFTVNVLKSQVVDAETIAVEASLDTFVTKNYPDRLYNEAGYLYLNGTGRQNFIRFKADSNAFFADATYASLNFYVNTVKSETSPSIILYGLLNDNKTSWEEAMNYDKAQELGLVDPSAESLGSGEYLATLGLSSSDAGSWVSIDITDFVKKQADGIAAFRFYGSAEARLATRESENAPYIEILSGDKGAAAADASATGVSRVLAENVQLPVQGTNGSTITWSSDNAAISVDENGNAVVTRGEADAACVLTATVSKGNAVVTKQFSVTVPSVLVSLSSSSTDEGSFVTTSLYEGYSLGSNQIFTAFYDEAGNLVNVHSGVGSFELTPDVKVVKAMLWKLNSIMPIEIQTLSAGEQVTE